MNFFLRIFYTLRLRMAARLADKRFAATGHRHVVIPVEGTHGHLIVVDRSNFRKLQRKHYIHHSASMAKCVRSGFYTSGGEAPLRLRQYLAWCLYERSRPRRIR